MRKLDWMRTLGVLVVSVVLLTGCRTQPVSSQEPQVFNLKSTDVEDDMSTKTEAPRELKDRPAVEVRRHHKVVTVSTEGIENCRRFLRYAEHLDLDVYLGRLRPGHRTTIARARKLMRLPGSPPIFIQADGNSGFWCAPPDLGRV